MDQKLSEFRNKLINKIIANNKYCFVLKVNNEASFFISSIPYCLRHLSGKVLFLCKLVFRIIVIKTKRWHNVIIEWVQRNDHSIDSKIFIMPFGQNTLTQECRVVRVCDFDIFMSYLFARVIYICHSNNFVNFLRFLK